MENTEDLKEQVKDIVIQESSMDFGNGKHGKLAVFFYTGSEDPMGPLDFAVYLYCQTTVRLELVDINMDSPRMRVVISNVNEMNQRTFDPIKDRLQS